MFTVIINDCRDPNATERQAARAASLIGGTVVTVGVQSDLEAAGCLVDALDAARDGQKGLILVNVAPRNGPAKKWPNGSPFGYFRYQGVRVLASVDGLTLSLAKKLGILGDIHLLDITAMTQKMARKRLISDEMIEDIISSQFRSFEFLPRAAWLIVNYGLPEKQELLSLKDIPTPPSAIWYVDCFGNAKTTLLPEDIAFNDGKTIRIMREGSKLISDIERGYLLTCYSHLADVPDYDGTDKSLGLVVGSSGIGKQRFLEIMLQGKSAADILGLKVGAVLF